ncbi:MAG: hypothetical protein QUS14_05755 [Pyrinomonadaceae bacterium]|nr:hypothetical protein [Pyrinomonadaceae bacterium]
MRPSSRWFPLKLSQQAVWLRNFAARFAEQGSALGFSAAEIAAIEADADTIEWLARNQVAVETFKRAAASYRRHVLSGKPGTPLNSYPQPTALTPPPGTAVGVYRRIAEAVERIRVAPGYSAQTAASFGIRTVRGEGADLNDAKPNPKLRVLPGNRVLVRFTRGDFDGVELQVRVDNAEKFTNFGRFLRSPAEIRIEPGPENLPRAVEVRARYLRGNDPVGQYSDTDFIATIP